MKKIKKNRLLVDNKNWHKHWSWWLDIVYGGKKAKEQRELEVEAFRSIKKDIKKGYFNNLK